MIELTEQQSQVLSGPEPVVIDPRTKARYVLVRQEIYERLKVLITMEEYNPDEGGAYIYEIMADDDAKDPYLSKPTTWQRYAGSV